MYGRLEFTWLARVREDGSYELYLGGVTFQEYWAELRKPISKVGDLGKALNEMGIL